MLEQITTNFAFERSNNEEAPCAQNQILFKSNFNSSTLFVADTEEDSE
jgi:hypothetical protein